MCFYAVLPALMIGFLFAAIQVKVFGFRNYMSIGGWSMWFLLGVVISYVAIVWGYVWHIKKRPQQYQVKEAANTPTPSTQPTTASTQKQTIRSNFKSLFGEIQTGEDALKVIANASNVFYFLAVLPALK